MPAATTAAHVARPCAAQAQRHAPAKQRRKRQRPVRSAQHVARALTIAKAEIGLIATVHKATAPIQIAHGPTALLAIALIAQKVIALSMTALVVTDRPVHLGHPALALINAATTVLVSVMTTAAEMAAPLTAHRNGVMLAEVNRAVETAARHVIKTEAPIVAETSVGVLTTAMVHAMTHVRTRVAQVAMIAKTGLDLIALAPTPPINANAMTATPHKHRAHQPSRKSAVMTTARCVCPS